MDSVTSRYIFDSSNKQNSSFIIHHLKFQLVMQQFIIRFGGLAPTFYAGDVHTCHPSEAKRFDTIEALRAEYGYKSDSLKGIQIIDADTLQFVQWYNW